MHKSAACVMGFRYLILIPVPDPLTIKEPNIFLLFPRIMLERRMRIVRIWSLRES